MADEILSSFLQNKNIRLKLVDNNDGTQSLAVTVEGGITIDPGQITIGAFELKDDLTDTRATVTTVAATTLTDPGVVAVLPQLLARTPYLNTALSNTAQSVKGSSGILGGAHITNPNDAVAYVQCYDTAGAVVVGTTTPTFVFEIPAMGGYDLWDIPGIAFTAGLKIAATTTAEGGTAPASPLLCNLFYT